MSASDKDRVNRLVLELLAENPDDAAVALFTRLCRQSPKLRAWLWDEFARSPKTRADFAQILTQSGKTDNLTLAEAAGEDRARAIWKTSGCAGSGSRIRRCGPTVGSAAPR